MSPRLRGGWTPLMLASYAGHAEVAGVLVEAGALTNSRLAGGWSPLLLACAHGRTEVARVLLEAGAPLDACNGSGTSPLMLACGGGHTGLVSCLLRSRADHRAIDGEGRTALGWACERGRESVVRELLAANASPGAAMPAGTTLLMLAAHGGHAGIVRELIRAGAASGLDVVREDGATALSLAVLCAPDEAAEGVAEELLESGASAEIEPRSSRDRAEPLRPSVGVPLASPAPFTGFLSSNRCICAAGDCALGVPSRSIAHGARAYYEVSLHRRS